MLKPTLAASGSVLARMMRMPWMLSRRIGVDPTRGIFSTAVLIIDAIDVS